MPTEDFIIELFCQVDDAMLNATKHSQATLFPSEVVTLALLFALKGCGNRAFYRWLENNWLHFFPSLPHRTRLFRLFNTHRSWVEHFMADPSLIGVIDSYGIELIHPRREGRSPKQIGKKGLSNQRWIVGGKLCLLLNHLGLVVGWDVDTANVYVGSAFQHLVEAVAEEMLVFADPHFVKSGWNPPNLKICAKGTWNDRMMIESVLSMLTVVCHFKKVGHRVWDYFKSRVGYTMALFNILVQWHGLQPADDGFVHLSIAEFSL
ncbi:MAG: transposase [Ardenticatenaceae bacterium]|nr:transposase [Ardenticatenaceae bacterium]